MAISKSLKNQWPWNNRPSARHVWRVKTQTCDVCERCGASFLHRVGGTGPVYCYPTPEYSAAHPEDDGKQG